MVNRDERPLTSARLASSLEIKIMIPVTLNTGLGFSFEWKPGVTVGTISRMERIQTREINRRYTLGRHAHEPLDIIPGRITTDLRLEKVIMYSEYMATYSGIGGDIAKLLGLDQGGTVYLSDGDALGAFGYVSGNLYFKQFPFAIEELVHPPEGLDGAQPTSISYTNCWFKTNPITYDLTGSDQLVMQDVEIAVGQVTSSIPASKAIVPALRKLLPNSIDIG